MSRLAEFANKAYNGEQRQQLVVKTLRSVHHSVLKQIMLQTFRAVLNGNSLEWSENAEQAINCDRPVQVLVTILEEAPVEQPRQRGQRMATVLQQLAQVQAFPDVDPVEWQRKARQDQILPGRSDQCY